MEIETELFGGRSVGTKTKNFPFHFLPAPPTPPAEEGKVSKFLVLGSRPKGACEAHFGITTQSERTIWVKATTRSARAKLIKILRILPEIHSNFVQYTPHLQKQMASCHLFL
ncbi:MAG: hypothetical protein WD312_04140 [Candidatus Paceibacterota bacterium]